MNKRQKNILAGRKPKQRVESRLSDEPVWGISPIVACAKWIDLSEQMRAAILQSFWVPAELMGYPIHVTFDPPPVAPPAEAFVVLDGYDPKRTVQLSGTYGHWEPELVTTEHTELKTGDKDA